MIVSLKDKHLFLPHQYPCWTAFYLFACLTLRAILSLFPFAHMLVRFIEWIAKCPAPQPGDNEHLRRFLLAGGDIDRYQQTYSL